MSPSAEACSHTPVRINFFFSRHQWQLAPVLHYSQFVGVILPHCDLSVISISEPYQGLISFEYNRAINLP